MYFIHFVTVFYCRNILFVYTLYLLFSCYTIDGHLGYSVWGYDKQCCYEDSYTFLWYTCSSSSVRYVSKNGIAKSKHMQRICTVSVLEFWQITFKSICAVPIYTLNNVRFQVLPYSCQSLVLAVSNFNFSDGYIAIWFNLIFLINNKVETFSNNYWPFGYPVNEASVQISLNIFPLSCLSTYWGAGFFL